MMPESHEDTEYDVIIIGAGSSGCVLANRLSETPDISILVLEAGVDRSPDEKVYTPALSRALLDHPDFDWQYTASADPGINGRRMQQPRGKTVGGTSAINSFALIYPSAAGMDAWSELGIKGWDWETMKPYFKKFQTIAPPAEDVKKELFLVHDDDQIQSSNGPIQASFPLHAGPLHKAWEETFANLNLQNREDPLNGGAIGGYTSTCHITGDTHERSHAGIAYLAPVMSRKNLTVTTGALVLKVLIEPDDNGENIASGVLFSKSGVVTTVRARREVILTAGVFETPHLLELSGIGNPEILSSHGIEIRHANPAVGENLQDHLRACVSLEAAEGVEPWDPNTANDSHARQLYEKDRSGPWAGKAVFSFAHMPLLPFFPPSSLESLFNEHHAEHHEEPNPFLSKRDAFIKKMALSPSEATATALLIRKPGPNTNPNKNYITLNTMLSHPFSRGSVHLTSPDPTKKPTIDFKYYSHPLDLTLHAHHLSLLHTLAATEPLASLIKKGPDAYADSNTSECASASASARDPPEHYPPPDTDIPTLKSILKETAMTNYHPCGTASMMAEGMGGVVDARLRVYGVRGLRVVDASVLPIIPRGNILTTVYAVAERGADLIREDLRV